MAYGEAVRAVTAVALALALAGCVAVDSDEPSTAPERRTTAAAVEQPGTVLVGGRRFATRCAGEPDRPSVLLVSGMGLDMQRSWNSVQPRIGAFARVCAYDRLGVGGSDRARRPQTFADMAADLSDVVAELELQRPVLVVAHGLGGMVAAELARQHPKQVAGLLLLDAPGPGYPQALLERLPTGQGADGAGLRRRWADLLQPATNRERLDGRTSFAANEAAGSLGDVPLLALTHSISRLGASVRPRQAADLESAWEEAQYRWLTLSTQARLERVELAGSFIQDDRPDVVVARVRSMLARDD